MNAYRLSLNAVLLLVFTVILSVSPAQAQPHVQAGDWELGFGLGATRFDVAFDLDEDEEEEELRSEIRGGYFLSDHFEIEAQVSRADALFGATFDAAMVNGVFNFGPYGAAVPYVLAGVGGARIQDAPYLWEEGAEEVDEEGLAVQAGIGTRIFFGSSRVAARLEASILSEELLDERTEHLSLTAGLVWRIGR